MNNIHLKSSGWVKVPGLKISTILLFILMAIILMVSLRGKPGNPTAQQLSSNYWTEYGPFELSPDRGRFALTFSIVEDKSFYFSLPVAKFATPDLGYKDGHYVSLFSPGLSFLIIPGYLIGKFYGLAQVGSFAVIALFGLANAFLIKKISEKLGANKVAANLAAIAFLFATPAFTYAVSLYQHHVSIFFLLASLWLLIKFKGLKPLLLVWALLGASVVVDYPNAFFAVPVGIYALGKMFDFEFKRHFKISFKLAGILTFVSVILPLGFLLFINTISYNNPFQLAGTVASVKAIDAQGRPTTPTFNGTDLPDKFLHPDNQQKSAVSFFQTRYLLQGFYIHLFSPDRGTLVYAPVALFGILGLFLLYKRHPGITAVIISVILVNLLLYSMWDDPWGGWAFGSRYMILSYAFLAIGGAYALTKYRKNYFFIGVFALVFTYSALVNTLGAITSSQNPPQAEILQLENQTHKEEKYTFARNSIYLMQYGSKSFVYQVFLSKVMSPIQFYLGLSSFIIMIAISQVTLLQTAPESEMETEVARILKKRGYKETYVSS